LGWCGEQKYVLLTNDTDFVDLAMETDHAGVIVSTSQSLGPGQVAKAVRRIDRQYTNEALHGSLVWRNNWL
jgi:predicted nuclease of predicted toxin-antitoxin system